jgi:hypothetical protein
MEVSSARGRVDGAIRSAADRRPVGQNPALAPETTPAPARGAASGRRPQSAGRHFVDSAQRGSLAGFARGVSVAVDLLAAAAGLGGARDLARDLACLSGRVE